MNGGGTGTAAIDKCRTMKTMQRMTSMITQGSFSSLSLVFGRKQLYIDPDPMCAQVGTVASGGFSLRANPLSLLRIIC
jgi:hypothetical protein